MSRGTADAAVGMMDAAYFTGRRELLDFFNNLLCLNLGKIEETASGAVACQITDIIFPNTINMTKVNWGARSDFEYVANYKLLQNAFSKNKVQRFVDVNKLIRAKHQDNLEFCQWLKAFFDQSGASCPDDYDPIEVRNRGKGGKQYNQKKASTSNGVAPRKPTTTTRSAATKPRSTAAALTTTNKNNATAKPNTNPASERFSRPLRDRTLSNKKTAPPPPAAATVDTSKFEAQIAELTAQNESLQATNDEQLATMEDLELAVLEIEKERDFYFSKLRNVEIMLQVHQETEESDPVALVDKVFKVLYATAEDPLTVNEQGELVADNLDEILADSV